MMKRLTTPLLALALAGFATTGVGQDGRGLAAMDMDGDGAISLAEVTALRQDLFARADLNADGLVDQAEADALRSRIQQGATLAEAAVGRSMIRLDADGDGALSKAEFTARTPLFSLLDTDGDAVLNTAEIARASAILRP
jgi:EF hand